MTTKLSESQQAIIDAMREGAYLAFGWDKYILWSSNHKRMCVLSDEMFASLRSAAVIHQVYSNTHSPRYRWYVVEIVPVGYMYVQQENPTETLKTVVSILTGLPVTEIQGADAIGAAQNLMRELMELRAKVNKLTASKAKLPRVFPDEVFMPDDYEPSDHD